MNQNNLAEKVINGLIWTYLERFLAKTISLLVSIILARLMLPEDYGVIAIVMIFIELANTLVVNGFGTALIQKEGIDTRDFSSMFYSSFLFSAAIYVIVYLAAPAIAGFYEMEIIIPVLRVMALRIPIASVNSIQQAYVSKQMAFKKFFFSTLGGTVFSAFVGIYMAFAGYGVWALVCQYMSNSIIDTVVLSLTSGWRLTREFSIERVKTLFSFGWKIVASSLLITLYGNIRDLIIGKRYSSSDLAYSNRGRQFPALISENINTSISKVLFPALSQYQNSREEMKRLTRRAIRTGTFVLTPVLVGLAAVAEPFVTIVLTEKWTLCVPFLKIMCIVYIFQPIQTASIQAMKALGRSDVYLRLEIWKKIAGILILLISLYCFRSVFAIIAGGLVAEILSTLFNFPANKKLLSYTYEEQIKDVIPPIVLSFAMWFILSFLSLLPLPAGILLPSQIILGVIMYISGSIVFKVESFRYLFNLIKKSFGRKFNRNDNA